MLMDALVGCENSFVKRVCVTLFCLALLYNTFRCNTFDGIRLTMVTQEQAKKDVLAAIRPDMDQLNAVIRQTLHSEVPLVNQISEYLISAGGKRLRPAIHLLLTRALQNDCPHSALTLAAVVEFIHTSTLLHDDVVDESDLRRGRQTANAMFGNAASVLVGDFLYSRSFQMMVSVQNMRVMEILADATNVIAEGEVLQLLNVHNADVSVDDYLRVIHYKTAKLFEASTRIGAILARAGAALERNMANFGMHLGTAFQIIDDVLDYTSDEVQLGKHLGDDLAEGKPTLPLIFAMQNGNAAQAARVREAIESGGRDDFAAVLEIIHAVGAIEDSRAAACREAEQARSALSALPPSIFKNSLLELCSFAVARKF